jgi:hypothetical protein
MVLPTKALVWATTGLTGLLVAVTGATVLAEGITVETPYILAFLAGAGGVIALLFRLLITSKDEKYAAIISEKETANALALKEKDIAIAEKDSVNKSYKEMATEAVKSATDMANFMRHKDGQPPIIPVAPVISESHSPSTEKQREAAEIATLRARLAATKLAVGQEAREEPPRAVENEQQMPVIDIASPTVVVPKKEGA